VLTSRRIDLPSAPRVSMAHIWNVPDPHIEHIANGLRKAGLAIAPASRPS
jgi:hypothetical protein